MLSTHKHYKSFGFILKTFKIIMASLNNSTAIPFTHSQRPQLIPEHVRILKICNVINEEQLTPKKFMIALLANQHPDVINRVKKWPCSGLKSTMELTKQLVSVLKKNSTAKSAWEDFVLEEVR